MTMEHSTEVAPSHGSGVARHCVQQRASSRRGGTGTAGQENRVAMSVAMSVTTCNERHDVKPVPYPKMQVLLQNSWSVV